MSTVDFTGILKASLSDALKQRVKELVQRLPSEARPLDEKYLHVTLMHQSLLKPHKALISAMQLPQGPEPILADEIHRIERPGKVSWIVLLTNQDEFRSFVDALLSPVAASTGASFSEDRVFHVSLANLDGSPFASVGDVGWSDVGGRDGLRPQT
jgi:hypothetical protein